MISDQNIGGGDGSYVVFLVDKKLGLNTRQKV